MSFDVKVYNVETEGSCLLSTHFKVREFKCFDGSKIVLISPVLIDVLEDLRKQMNTVFYINSGYRTVTHNKAIGGASNSMHMYGLAADVRPFRS